MRRALGPRPARQRRPLRLLTAAMLACGLLTSATWHASATATGGTTDLLHTAFGGSFSSGSTYTAATGETMDGVLVRRTGGELTDPADGIQLHGGQEGLTFTPSTPISGGTVQQPFVMEAAFTPAATQGSLATVFALGGNLFARYNGSSLQYGFSANNNGTWSDATKTVPAPAAGTQHVLSVAYEPTTGGATMHAFLDGAQLPDAVSTSGPAGWNDTSGAQAGFGNDVHPSALSRGLTGSLRQVRLATFTAPFVPADLALQTVRSSAKRLSVDFEGAVSANGAYHQAEGETADDGLTVTGGRITTPGTLRLAAAPRSTTGISWDTAPLGTDPLGSGVLAESVVAPELLQPGTPVMNVLGLAALTALDQHTVRLSAGAGHWDVKLPAAQSRSGVRYQHLALAVEPDADGLALTLVTGDHTVSGPFHVAASDAPAAVTPRIDWLTGARGTVYGVAVTAFSGLAPADVRVLGSLPCLATKVAPAQQISIMPGECLTSLVAKASAVRPDGRQISWQELQQTAFLHFGVNTFTGAEWGTGQEDPDVFQPTQLDTDQWARTLRDAGFKLAILTVKHHDGFLLYPSRYTTHDVASSSWEGGKGDVLGDFATSMRKYGLKVGVYISPADENQYADGVYANGSAHTPRTIPTLVPGDDRAGKKIPGFTLTADDYGAYMLNQLYEVLTQYGPIDEVWFDGAQGRIPAGKVENYDFPSWYQLIRALAPQAVIAVTGPDVRWVGNESGVARPDEWSVLPTVTTAAGSRDYALSYSAQDEGSRSALLAGRDSGASALSWWPAECDVSIHDGWFYHANQQPKSVQQLTDIYYKSVGRNADLLLNIPPDQDGQIAPADVARLTEWRARIDADMPSDLALKARATGDGQNAGAVVDGKAGTDWVTSGPDEGTVQLTLPAATTVDRIALGEDIHFGQQLESAVVEAQATDGSWSQVATVGSVGYQRIIALDQPVTTTSLRLRVLHSRAAVHLDRISLFHATSS